MIPGVSMRRKRSAFFAAKLIPCNGIIQMLGNPNVASLLQGLRYAGGYPHPAYQLVGYL
jgi:hypothetical protein